MATATALLALTTPFVQKPECSSIFDVTSVSFYTNGTTRTVTALASNAADPRFAACQPSGWDAVVPVSRFSFSPAVCPTGWTYYAVAETVDVGKSASTYSTAYCCASGHSLRTDLSTFGISTIHQPCYRSLNPGDAPITVAAAAPTETAGTGTDASATATPFVLAVGGALVHQAWHVSWAASDTSTLTPALPSLTNSKFLPTWTPGQAVAPGEGDRVSGGTDDGTGLGRVVWFLEIGIPIIAVLVIGGAVWWCCAVRRRRTRRRRAATMQAEMNRLDVAGR